MPFWAESHAHTNIYLAGASILPWLNFCAQQYSIGRSRPYLCPHESVSPSIQHPANTLDAIQFLYVVALASHFFSYVVMYQHKTILPHNATHDKSWSSGWELNPQPIA